MAGPGAALPTLAAVAGCGAMLPATEDPAVSGQAHNEWAFLTGARTFPRPIADQRWPVFSGGYRWQDNGRFLDAYEYISAGDTIALARGPVALGEREHELELAVQGGIFSIFDPAIEHNLIVIDYVAGAHAALRRGPGVGMLRFWHISGHIGDEFLQEPSYGVDERTPYKFEAIQFLGSYDVPGGFRAYAGPSFLFGVNPEEFGDLILHLGLEWRGDMKLFDVARPIAGLDVQMVDGLDYQPDISLRAGFSLDRGLPGPAVQLMGELYHGRDPNGELFSDRVSFAGVGIFINL